MTSPLILPLDTDEANLALVGGKGNNLTQLVRAGLPVPDGFLVTTQAYQKYVRANGLKVHIQQTLDEIRPDDPTALTAASKAIRQRFADGNIPPDLTQALQTAYAERDNPPVAVRSSATAEDLPDMSFAGQQDTFLNVVGLESLLQAVVDCWSSLWTARAIGYRARNDIPHDQVSLAVVVQEMVPSQASGVLFTANPLTGKRTEMVIDATLGLGEALVSGRVEPDHYIVDAGNGRIIDKSLGSKAVSIRGQAGGGTVTVREEAADRPALQEAVIGELVKLGRRAAALFDSPQDIEWAWANGRVYALQSRPITSLYPVPVPAQQADSLQVMFSFGAVQGILEPMTPLGQDTIKGVFAAAGHLFGRSLTAATQQVIWVAGERLFVNVTAVMRHPVGRRLMRQALDLVEPGAAQAIQRLWHDPRLAPSPDWFKWRTVWRVLRFFGPVFGRLLLALRKPDTRREQLQQRIESIVTAFNRRSRSATNLSQRVNLLQEAIDTGFPTILPHFLPVIAGGMASLNMLNRIAAGLPGDSPNVLALTRGLPHNVTTEMDLALWHTAQTIRADSAALSHTEATDAATLAAAFKAGTLPTTAQTAMVTFLQQYGMRGIGEIDIGRPRWREDPKPVILTLKSYLHIEDNQAPDTIFRRGAVAAQVALEELVTAVRHTRGGRWKAWLVRVAARRMRALAGQRETPKFFMIRMLGLARAALLQSGQELVDAGVLNRADDVFFLHLQELKALAAGEGRDWLQLVAERRAVYKREQKRRQVPRLLLSDGQAFYEGMATSAQDGDDVLVGSPVSPGTVEGQAHIVLDPHGVQLAPGEILVCPGTDPAWTPLFLAAGGLVMEVGGMMTHGSVVAREYGIPAVVGVHEATTRLTTGQRIRIDGTTGRVKMLDGSSQGEKNDGNGG